MDSRTLTFLKTNEIDFYSRLINIIKIVFFFIPTKAFLEIPISVILNPEVQLRHEKLSNVNA